MSVYGGRHKSRAAYRIAKNSEGKVSDTAPELLWDQFAAFTFPRFEQGRPAPFTVESEGKDWTITVDRQLGGVLIELDGPYHSTAAQQRKTRWRDGAIINSTDRRILHVDAILTQNRWWPYLAGKVAEFMASSERVGRVFA